MNQSKAAFNHPFIQIDYNSESDGSSLFDDSDTSSVFYRKKAVMKSSSEKLKQAYQEYKEKQRNDSSAGSMDEDKKRMKRIKRIESAM